MGSGGKPGMITEASGTFQNNTNFDVLLTVQCSIFISVFNQLDAQNLCIKLVEY